MAYPKGLRKSELSKARASVTARKNALDGLWDKHEAETKAARVAYQEAYERLNDLETIDRLIEMGLLEESPRELQRAENRKAVEEGRAAPLISRLDREGEAIRKIRDDYRNLAAQVTKPEDSE